MKRQVMGGMRDLWGVDQEKQEQQEQQKEEKLREEEVDEVIVVAERLRKNSKTATQNLHSQSLTKQLQSDLGDLEGSQPIIKRKLRKLLQAHAGCIGKIGIVIGLVFGVSVVLLMS